MSDNYTFICPRCGNEVNGNARYCMKCGYLNPAHPDNQQYMKLIDSNKESYSVSNGQLSNVQVNLNEVRGGAVNVAFGSNTGSFTICFIVNFVCYLLAVVGLVGASYSMYGDFQLAFASELSYLLFGLSIFSLFNYARQLIYMKMNCRWWASFVPIYDIYALSYAVFEKKWVFLLAFVPFVSNIYVLVLLYKLGESFNVNGLLMVLFPFIMIPVIAYGGHAFKGYAYISERDSLEKEYGKKKLFLISCVVVFVASIVMFIYSNTVSINKGIDKLSSYYLYAASQRVIKRTQLKIDSLVYECDTDDKTMYFYFSDLDDYFSIPFYAYRDPIEAYVKVVEGADGEKEYYISMTDKKYGFPETKIEDLEIESVTEFAELNNVYESGNQCYFKRNG